MRRISAYTPRPCSAPILGAAILAMVTGARLAAQTPAPTRVPLADTHWMLTTLGDQALPAAPSDHDRPGLVLQSTGSRVAGTTGCNRIMGPYQRNGRSLTIGPLATTRMACPDLADQEAEYLRRLAEVRSWRIRRDRLTLYGESGVALARFQAAPPAASAP